MSDKKAAQAKPKKTSKGLRASSSMPRVNFTQLKSSILRLMQGRPEREQAHLNRARALVERAQRHHLRWI